MPEPRQRVGAIRAWWRTVHPPPTVLKRLEPVYYILITLGIGGPFIYGTASTELAAVATPHALAIWGPPLALVGLLALARWGAVQGPVVFSVADVAHLLGAPLRRAELVLGRLARGLLAGAGAGAVVAGVVLVGVAGDGRGVAAGRAAAFVVAVGLLGLMGVAGASLVQGSARWDRATRRAGWPVVAAAVALAVAGSAGATGRAVERWSGPWGWAVQPLVSGGGAWVAGLALTGAAALAAVLVALARRGACPTERHLARAEARGGAVAALYSFNARYVRRSLGAVAAGPAGGRALRLAPPRSPRLAVAWRDAAAALAAPQRLTEAIALAAGGTALCLADAEHPAATAAGALVIYAGAARLLEPLRAETDQPGRVRVLLRAPMGRVLVGHALVPTLAVLTGALLAVAGCAAAGALPDHGATVAALAVAATPAIALCAALSSRRGGQLPAGLLATASTDQSGMGAGLILGWVVVWPAAAAALGAAPLSIVARHGTAGVPQLVALLVCAPLGLAMALGVERLAP